MITNLLRQAGNDLRQGGCRAELAVTPLAEQKGPSQLAASFVWRSEQRALRYSDAAYELQDGSKMEWALGIQPKMAGHELRKIFLVPFNCPHCRIENDCALSMTNCAARTPFAVARLICLVRTGSPFGRA